MKATTAQSQPIVISSRVQNIFVLTCLAAFSTLLAAQVYYMLLNFGQNGLVATLNTSLVFTVIPVSFYISATLLGRIRYGHSSAQFRSFVISISALCIWVSLSELIGFAHDAIFGTPLAGLSALIINGVIAVSVHILLVVILLRR